MWSRRVGLASGRCTLKRCWSRQFSTHRTLFNAAIISTPVQHILSSYPIFNLNSEQERTLGPVPGDEAILTLSGGVDSSMAAYLAIKKGGLIPYKTIFMRNWNSLEESESFEPGAGGSEGCQWLNDWNKVEKMAKWFDIKAELVDLSSSYWNSVFAPALDDWQSGKTPNPDIACNREIKFGELLRLIDGEGGEQEEQQKIQSNFGRKIKRRWLVTGHYAHVEYFYPFNSSFQHGKLLRAEDSGKDQSYFLSGVSSFHLGRSHFPLANVQKEDVRAAARALGMPTAESEESMGLCFVGKRNKQRKDEGKSTIAKQIGFAGFLGDYIDSKPGQIVGLNGENYGIHSGLHSLTIGQRAKVGGEKQKLFVAAKDKVNNQIIVVPGIDHPMLQCEWLEMKNFHIISPSTFCLNGNLKAQIRHRQIPVECQAEFINDRLRVRFKESISSVAEGQVCALYDNENRECLGSGVITKSQTKASLDSIV